MESLLDVLDPALPLALTATTLVYVAEFLSGREKRVPGSRTLLLGSVALLLTRFGVFVSVMGRPPLASPGEAFSTIALALVLLYAAVEVLHRERSTGFLLLAAATVFQGIGFLGGEAAPVANEMLREPWFGVHAVSAIIGYTAFAVSAVYAALFLLLYRDLKRRRFGLMYQQMPSLDVLSRMSIRTATLGFGFLTVAMIVGAVGWSRVLDHPALADPKVVSTLLVWVTYGVGVSLYYFAGWRGVRCIGITLVAFVLMVLSTFLVPLVLGSSHGVKGLL